MRTVKPGVNDISSLRPDLVSQWHPDNELDPSQVATKSNKLIHWICPLGHDWWAKPFNRKTGECPFCRTGRGRKLWSGFNDLETLFPDVAAQWHPDNPRRPSEVLPDSNDPVMWVCVEGHVTTARPSSRTRGTGCGVCANLVLLEGVNDLATTHPGVAATWDHELNDDAPQDVVAGTPGTRWWRCPEGHSWPAPVANRTLRSSGCTVCSGKIVLAGFNDLASQNPTLAAEWHPDNEKRADEVLATGKFRARWICSEGHVWEARISDRAGSPNRRGSSCESCRPVSQSLEELRLWRALEDLGLRVVVGFKDGIPWKGGVDARVEGTDVLLEYDGAYWHSKRGVHSRDVRKSERLIEDGWTVVRLRQTGLDSLDVRSSGYHELEIALRPTDEQVRLVAEQVCALVADLRAGEKRRHPRGCLSRT